MSAAKITRDDLIRHLHLRLEEAPAVLAAWLGGSEATGRTDALSDVDLQLLVEDDDVEAVFVLVSAALEELSPIAGRYRTPEPTWHGLSQEFFQLRDAAPDHVLDLAVVRRSTPPEKRFLEPERHGVALVLFDRTGEIAPTALDREAHLARMDKRLAEVRAQYDVLQPVVTRAARRGYVAEAVTFYQSICVRPLAELLRMRHAPLVFDFGLRYLDRDLPGEPREFIEARVLPRDLEELERMRRELVQRFHAELAALDSGGWTLAP